MPENENKPKKKRGFLWIIIIILIFLLAATAGGYALSYYNLLPGWVTDMLPASSVSAPLPIETPAMVEEPEEMQVVTETPAPELTPSPSPASEADKAEAVQEDKSGNKDTAAVSAELPEQTAPAVTAAPYIGADAAAKAVLEHSKVAEKDADFNSVLLVEKNGMMMYEAVFTAGEYSYEYYLDAYTGRVESWRKSSLSTGVEDAVAASAQLPNSDKTEAAAGVEQPAKTEEKQSSGTVLLGEDEAKKLAMAHANITEKDLSSIQCKIELQGLNLIYEIDMKTKLMEYEYEVDAITGDIVGFDVESISNPRTK